MAHWKPELGECPLQLDGVVGAVSLDHVWIFGIKISKDGCGSECSLQCIEGNLTTVGPNKSGIFPGKVV